MRDLELRISCGRSFQNFGESFEKLLLKWIFDLWMKELKLTYWMGDGLGAVVSNQGVAHFKTCTAHI